MNANAIRDAIKSATGKWAKQRKAEERAASAALRRQSAWRTDRVTIKDAAESVMEAAYLKASANGALPASARQIMYAGRGRIQAMTGQELDDKYFTQTLLPDFMNDNPELTAEWDVVFDARGNLTEPHTEKRVPLGTLNVREYLADMAEGTDPNDIKMELDYDFPTVGPKHRYGALLFIEKEGFAPVLERAKIAERYDVCVISTKGMSVTACRQLVDTVCAANNIPLFILRDFDKSGFSIVGTLSRDNRRYTFTNKIKVIDLGLRLSDVEENNLVSESVVYGKSDPELNLRENSATTAEVKFLCSGDRWSGYRGQRVELNAFASDEFITWIEKKLEANGVKKVIPDAETLEIAYRRAARIAFINNVIKKHAKDAADFGAKVKLPKGLNKAIAAHLKKHPADSWDEAIARQVAKLDPGGDE